MAGNIKKEGFADIGDAIQARREKERYQDKTGFGRNLPGLARILCTIENKKGETKEVTVWITKDQVRGTQTIPSPDVCMSKNHWTANQLQTLPLGYHKGFGEHIGRDYATNITIHDRVSYLPSNENYLARDLYVTLPDETPKRYFPRLSNLLEMRDRIKQALQRKAALEREMREAQLRKEKDEAARRLKEAEEQKKREEAKRQAEAELRKRQAEMEEALKRERAEAKRIAEEKAALERQAREEEERRARELAEQHRKEEEERLAREAAEAAEREEQERKIKEVQTELAKLEEAARQDQERQRKAYTQMLSEYEAKETPDLDLAQRDAKTAHIYDGIPVVIEGGPGTGKTATLVQRVAFLLSNDGLSSFKNQLSQNQISNLSDELTKKNKWLFIAPNQLLLNYLEKNMAGEGLQPNQEVNAKTIDSLRSDMMLAYRLTNPARKGPFLEYKPEKKDRGRKLILQPIEVIADFEAYFVSTIKVSLSQLVAKNTEQYSWHKAALPIKGYCNSAESIENISGLISLFFDLQDKLSKTVTSLDDQLKEQINLRATSLKRDIQEDEVLYAKVKELFEKWQTVAIVADNQVVSETELTDNSDEEDDINSSNIDFGLMLFKELKKLLPKIALIEYNPTQLTAREQILYDLIREHVVQYNLTTIGELKLFSKYYSQRCSGIESNIFDQMVRVYKLYRQHLLMKESKLYDLEYLDKIVKKDNNKRVHNDEKCLLIGFVNNLLRKVHDNYPWRFSKLKSQDYVNAYRNNVKYIIAVDEATDYSLLDYYMIASFRHYEISSVCLCGDLMQGLNDNGITEWQQLERIGLEKLDIKELLTSYRQTPVLLEMARQMYFDERGTKAPYHSNRTAEFFDASPIKFISDDEDEKLEWMANRIVEVYKARNGEMPSVAIFIGDKENIDDFVENITDKEVLDGIKIFNGATTTVKKCVRVYHLSEVKGMEFEVAFFHNIDKAIAQDNSGLMKRHLYVGISRAASHLAATFCEEEGNEGVLKYFDNSVTHW